MTSYLKICVHNSVLSPKAAPIIIWAISTLYCLSPSWMFHVCTVWAILNVPCLYSTESQNAKLLYTSVEKKCHCLPDSGVQSRLAIFLSKAVLMKTDSSLIGIVTISNCTMKQNDCISTAILIQNFYIPKTLVKKVRLELPGPI